jgi:thioredoxin-related protein
MKTPAWMITLTLLAAFWVPRTLAADEGALQQISWLSYADATAKSAGERKYFIYLYSDRCPTCVKLKKTTLSDRAIIDYINANYTPIKANVDQDQKLAALFRIQGVPDLIFLNPKGEEISRWPGFIDSKRLLILLQYIGTDSYQKISYMEFVKRQDAQ